jgi:hypothetical protein
LRIGATLFRAFDFGAFRMPPALTSNELDMVRLAKQAMIDLDGAKPGAARVLARQRLERIQIELEKLRSTDAEALRLIKRSLARPIDAATGAMTKAAPQRNSR